MEIKITDRNNFKIVALSGELILSTVKDFQDKVFPVFKLPCKGVAIDMEGIAFMDSSGVSLLVKALNNLKALKKELILFNLNDNVQKVINLVGLKNFLNIMTSVEFERKCK